MKKLIVLASLIVSSVFSLSQAEVLYTVADLGALGNYSFAHSINDSGQVAGYSYIGRNPHAFLYDGTTMNDLGTLGGTGSHAKGINDSGQVVGESYFEVGRSVPHAFLYDGSTMNDLGTLGGTSSWAYGINDSGQVVGKSRTAGGDTHAFLYDGLTMHDLGTLGGSYSVASAINNSGQVVGISNSLAFLYDGTAMKGLGTLGGTWSSAKAINNSGQVAGISRIAEDSEEHAFLYDGTEMFDLGTLGGNISRAAGINDSGQVVGSSNTGGSGVDDTHAFLYDGTDGMLDLNDLIASDSGWVLKQANDINSSGQIVGWGTIDDNNRAFLLTPEPVIIQVSVDIKPDSCPNPLRVNFIGKGVYPVAIIGSEDFDVTDIDVDTITLEGVAALRGKVGDVNQDGVGDLVLKFDRQAILDALEAREGALGDLPNRKVLTLTLFAESSAGLISGTDTLVILNRGAIKRKK